MNLFLYFCTEWKLNIYRQKKKRKRVLKKQCTVTGERKTTTKDCRYEYLLFDFHMSTHEEYRCFYLFT
jgi:hypothetical protein